MEKNKRFVILLGIVIALLSFYIGLESWISSKEKPQPPPVVVTPTTQTQQDQAQFQQKDLQKEAEEPKGVSESKEDKQDVIAKAIQDNKVQQEALHASQESAPKKEEQTKQPKRGSKKSYVVQIGAFSNEDNAAKALSKAKSMGYSPYIKEEDNFYKVIIKVQTDDINAELKKLRAAFGGAILK